MSIGSKGDQTFLFSGDSPSFWFILALLIWGAIELSWRFFLWHGHASHDNKQPLQAQLDRT